MKKILIVRLSSFGDIVQCLSVTKSLKKSYPQSEISFLTKKQFASLVALNKDVSNIISFDRKNGLIGWIKMCFKLREEGFDFIYDAHCNIRTRVLKLIMLGSGVNRILTRSKERFKRFLLFYLKINRFPKPFKGMESFHHPIKSIINKPVKNYYQIWDFSKVNTQKVNDYLPMKASFIAISPSAAWEMKRWPLGHWKSLLAQYRDHPIVILGGPEDHFCEELTQIDADRIINLAGKLTLPESCYVISKCSLFISADTGLIHVAEILNRPGISLVGPTAFGFATHENIKTLEVALKCRPCTKDGRGKCSQDVYQKCLVEITPTQVASEIRKSLN